MPADGRALLSGTEARLRGAAVAGDRLDSARWPGELRILRISKPSFSSVFWHTAQRDIRMGQGIYFLVYPEGGYLGVISSRHSQEMRY